MPRDRLDAKLTAPVTTTTKDDMIADFGITGLLMIAGSRGWNVGDVSCAQCE